MKLELNSNFYLADKPKTWTSQDLCTKFRKNYKFGKVGHSGTLDPLATGLMLLATNKYTKLFDYIDDTTKNYRVEALLGFKSETLDIMSEMIKTDDIVAVDHNDDIKKFFESKLGKSQQQPPKYSAVKVKGKRLYKYARQNKDVDIPMREIEIFNIENISYNLNIVTFDIKVSKGTYIRTIVSELGEFINSTAIVNNLKRINIGSLSTEDTRLISNVETLKNDSIIESIHWSEIIDLKELKVNENQIENIRNGNLIDSNEFSSREKFAISFKNNLIAIYEPFSEDFFKPDKVFI